MEQFTNLESYPLVCTRGAIVFPQQELIIDIGRRQSINAINEARLNNDGYLVLVSQLDPAIEQPKVEDIAKVGTLVNIKNVRTQDGYLRVKFLGITRVLIDEANLEDAQYTAKVRTLIDLYSSNDEEVALVRKLIKEFDLSEVTEGLFTKEMLENIASGVEAGALCDQLAAVLNMELEEKIDLLSTIEVNERLLKLIQVLEKEKMYYALEQKINNKVKDRMEESQKEYYLREKMRAIKEELGDVPDSDKDIENLRKKINDNPYPENIKAKALEELQRYEMLPSVSSESGVVRTYLDWLINIPWWQTSDDNENLNKASEILDSKHYGLEKVKERILEYLAVKQHTKSLKAPILCLVGPPGVGKTSLGKSVAEALGRKFVKISLGGVKDESEIRGHRRTYLGSMPGRFIQAMKKAGTTNPVFLIDEIDKMASDYKGDPASAMLEVLDPEQNSLFSDHYLEEPYDLSNILFIATANYLENIPAALQDRLEIINLSSYTEIEKLNIARKHIVNKQLDENSLKSKQFSISDDLLLYIIRYYTRESGVRSLERIIATLVRKTVLAILKDNVKNIEVTKELINKWLGPEKHEYGKKDLENQVGTVNGLAYTAFGGDILQVEVNYFAGKGKLVITGQLGDVMKESATIAYDYVKANASKYNIDEKFFEKFDVHIHVPEGAVPKDGPSAGVTLTTALISALSDVPVNKDVAMTGEVTLRGNVLAIGGLKEKSMAAHRSGIKTILIPKANVKDLEEVPSIVKESIKFIPCEHVSQVLDNALVK